MNRQGPGRGNIGLNAFNMQQAAPANRGGALNSANLANNKLGTGSGWGYNPAGAVAGDPNVRAGNVTTGRANPPRPQDTSQYPPLGAAATQQQNSNSSIWPNRASQQTPVQRPQHAPSSQSTSSSNQPLNLQTQGQTQRVSFPTPSPFTRPFEDYRHGGQGIPGQLLGNEQAQPGSPDDFSTLDKSESGDSTAERRGSTTQHNAHGLFSSGQGLTQQAGLRNPLANPAGSHSETGGITSPNTSLSGASRSPLPRDQNGVIGQDRYVTNGSSSDGLGMSSIHSATRSVRPDEYSRQHISSFQQDSLGADSQETFASRLSRMTPWTEMAPIDKWGLAGLLAQMHTISKDQLELARGQDLTQLGLDLNSSEPLYPTFATPFARPAHSRPLEADYHIPSCYAVANVKPLQERLGILGDDCLIYIFYSETQTILQVEAADELNKRKWRWNMRERIWITKDETDPPSIVSADGMSERGRYWYWDVGMWRKVKKDMIVVYGDLHQNNARGANGLNGDGFSGGGGGPPHGMNGGANGGGAAFGI